MNEEFPEELLDRYTFEEVLGRGGMGVVYRAHDRFLGKDVAIKLLSRAFDDADVLARFQREAQTASKLKHQNLVEVLDFGVLKGDKPYMVLEYLPGMSLEQLLDTKGPLSLDESLPIFLSIVRGLGHAHSQGVLHRDLKPGNVIVDNTNEVKIVDFGIARTLQSDGNSTLTRTGAIIGSPLYMSPEQAQSEEVDERSDLYSFGCLMFKTLTGSPPFQGDSVLETLSLKCSADTPTLNDFGIESSCHLDSVIEKCLAKDASHRYLNADELESDLEKLMLYDDDDHSESGDIVESQDTEFNPTPVSWTGRIVFVFVVVMLVTGVFLIRSFLHWEGDSSSSTAKAKIRLEDKVEKSEKIPPEAFREVDNGLVEILDGADENTFTKVSNLTNLKKIRLMSANVDAACYDKLSLSGIEELELKWVENLDASIFAKIANIKGLQKLRVFECYGVTPEGVSVLDKAPDLMRLFFERSEVVDDHCMKNIATMPKLTMLGLRGSAVTCVGLSCLKSDRLWQELDLAEMKLKDSDLSSISRLRVRSLNLTNNPVSLEGILDLVGKMNLLELTLKDQKWTEADKLLLSRRNPAVIFHFKDIERDIEENWSNGKKLQ